MKDLSIFNETLYKMDKWAAEVQSEFYEIIDNTETSFEEKVAEMEEFLEVLVWDWERLEYYMQDEDGKVPEYTQKDLATALVKSNI